MPNSGEPGSTCEPTSSGLPYTPPGAGVSTSGLPADAPAYYEVGQPNGPYIGKIPAGVMLNIHGGGWFLAGKEAVAASRVDVDRWRNRGWQTYNITYRGCEKSVEDATWFYDSIRAKVGPKTPLCITGGSAGGHLALMIAGKRPDVACVIARGAPSDLEKIESQAGVDLLLGGTQTAGPQKTYNWAVAAFGKENLAANSPINYPINTRVYLASTKDDYYVPWQQTLDLKAAISAANPSAYIDTQELARGVEKPHVHGNITAAAYYSTMQRELRAIDPIVPAIPLGSQTKLSEMRLKFWGEAFNGLAQLGVTNSTTSTSATLTGQTVVGGGKYYRVQSCIGVYPPDKPAFNKCKTTTWNTLGKIGNIPYTFPALSHSWTRSGAGPGYVMGFHKLYMAVTAVGPWTEIGTTAPGNNFSESGLYYQ